MKEYILYKTVNGGEYSDEIIINAHNLTCHWSSTQTTNTPFDGDYVIADGVKIQFDEPFELYKESDLE